MEKFCGSGKVGYLPGSEGGTWMNVAPIRQRASILVFLRGKYRNSTFNLDFHQDSGTEKSLDQSVYDEYAGDMEALLRPEIKYDPKAAWEWIKNEVVSRV